MDKNVLCEIDHMHKMELKSFFSTHEIKHRNVDVMNRNQYTFSLQNLGQMSTATHL